jgi:hypothetical protein
MKVTDEMLMSLVDGELDEETALGVMRSVDADPALRRRLAEFQETRVLAKQAFGAVLEEPVPARLVAAVGKAGRGGPIGWPWPTSIWLPIGAAVAASVAGFAVATALMAPRDVPALLPDSQEIASLLQTTPTGEARPWADKRGAPGSGVFQATGSYPFPEGVCRAFSLSTSAADAIEWRGVACHHGEVWNVEIIVAGQGLDESGFFSTASDRATQSIDAFLDAMGAGGALDATAEQRYIESGWQQVGAASQD